VLLKEALTNTTMARGTMEELKNWESQVDTIKKSEYQERLWEKYQHSFKYARKINFDESVIIVEAIMKELIKLANDNPSKTIEIK
jgi:hypothetical protein